MIIADIPYRISYFGGGSDYPVWYESHGGAVLTSTIDKYCKILCRPMPTCHPFRYHLMYSKIEQVNRIAEIQHPAIRGVLQHLNFQTPVEIVHLGDLPARSGMGSSSAFTVGLLKALHELRGETLSKEALAKEAIYVEHHVIDECVGIQDQIETAYGGLNKIVFGKTGTFEVQPIPLTPSQVSRFESHLLLFFTGITRFAPTIAQKQVEAIPNRQHVIKQLVSFVDVGVEILKQKKEIDDFGILLHEAWRLKKSIVPDVTNATIDHYYQLALNAGALGGKILGAGAGGFILLFAKPENHAAIKAQLSDLIHVPFHFSKVRCAAQIREVEWAHKPVAVFA